MSIVHRVACIVVCSLLLISCLFGCRSADMLPIDSPSDMEFSELFDKNQMLCVSLSMYSELFDLMANENRFSPEQLNHAEVWDIAFEYFDGTGEIPNYYNWYTSDVYINDINLKQVGIRNKGFLGSLAWPSPAFKMRTDKSIKDQSIANQKYLTFNNASSDWTRFRTLLTLELFAAADYPAPLCNLAKVELNRNPLGIYVNIEPVKESFLMRSFGNNTGSLYEGLTSLDLKYLSCFEVKTDNTDAERIKLIALFKALDSPDEKLIQNLSQYLNIDLFIRFWALEMVSGHIDGYSANQNNYYIYFNPADHNRAIFIPWGVDMTFMSHDDNPIFNSYHYLMSKIPKRLSEIPYMKQRMEEEVTWVLDKVWNTEEILQSIDRYEDLILNDFEYYAQPIDVVEYKAIVQDLRLYVKEQPKKVIANLKPMFDLQKEPGTKTHNQKKQFSLIGKVRWEKLMNDDLSIGLGFIDALITRVRHDMQNNQGEDNLTQATSFDWFIAMILVSDALPFIIIICFAIFLIMLTSIFRRIIR